MSVRVLKVQADGGSRGNPGPAAYGAVVIDPETGAALAERAEFLGKATNNVAEYKGLIAGLEAAVEIDPEAHVDVELDSKLVVEQISGRWKVKHPDMKALCERAREISPGGGATYSWIPRAQNAYADRLANEAMDAGAKGLPWVSTLEPAPSSNPASSNRAPTPTDGGIPADPTPDYDDSQPLSEADVADQQRRGDEFETAYAPDRVSPAATTLVLVRHGVTEMTLQRRFAGSDAATDPPLTAFGAEQAERVAKVVAGLGSAAGLLPEVNEVRSIVSSPLRRAVQTASPLADLLALPVQTHRGLKEQGFGQWEGRTFTQTRSQWPEEFAAAVVGTYAPPGGEPLADLRTRAVSAKDAIIGRFTGQTVAVYAHTVVIRALLADALDTPLSSLGRIRIEPASLSVIRYFETGEIEVITMNDAAHHRGI